MRMRLLAGLILIGGLAVAGGKEEAVTYVDGNVTGVVANSGGSLVFDSDSAMELRTGLATVPVPYKSIVKAELGETHTHSDPQPLYKVWSLHKRIFKSETRFVRVNFKSDEGEEKTMLLEMSSSAAPNVVETIQRYNESVDTGAAKQSAAAGARTNEWWGDSYWKTTRNASQWPTEQKNEK